MIPRLDSSARAGLRLFVASLSLAGLVVAQSQYSIDSKDAIRETAAGLAYDLMLYYEGNQTGKNPGILPGPPDDGLGDYYWWEGGALMGTMIDYWKLTGDSSYNKVVMQGMVHQSGDNRDYQPTNFTVSLGNDDQGFWGMTAMLAAENKFPDPPEDEPQWLSLAQAVWNTQADPERHDDVCGGGMRWQVPTLNTGYDYKNTIANGIFMNMGARLARYTENDTYAEHAEETWQWLWDVKYIDHDTWNVYDGAHDYDNCTKVDKTLYSYNTAVLTEAAAFMYNYTESEKWDKILGNLLDATLKTFFDKKVAFEVSCEPRPGSCSTDMKSFKGYLHRWLAVVSQIAPKYADQILPVLESSARAAISQCTGGASGRQCGLYWLGGKYVDVNTDGKGTTGAGEQMSVLGAVSSLLITDAEPPVTNRTGGTSKGDPDAGRGKKKARMFSPITMGDRVGAGILTALILGGAIGTFVWMSILE